MAKKIGLVFLIILLLMGFVLANLYRKNEVKETAQELEGSNQLIRKLESEKEKLQRQLEQLETDAAAEDGEKVETDEDSEETDTHQNVEIANAVLCFSECDETLYTDIYPKMSEKNLTGIIILPEDILPGDYGVISSIGFANMMQNGWQYAISLESNAFDANWQDSLETYLQRLSTRVGVMPTVYRLTDGEYNEEKEAILQENGFFAVLTDQTEMLSGELQQIVLFPYGEDDLNAQMVQSDGYYGVEVCLKSDEHTEEDILYDADAFSALLEEGSVRLQSLNMLEPTISDADQQKDVTEKDMAETDELELDRQQILDRIKEIDMQITELYSS